MNDASRWIDAAVAAVAAFDEHTGPASVSALMLAEAQASALISIAKSLAALSGSPTVSDYFCEVCHQSITGPDIADMHTTPDGEDCHRACCPECEQEAQP